MMNKMSFTECWDRSDAIMMEGALGERLKREYAPEAWRLHMVGEPLMAAHIPVAQAAHARIDSWGAAEGWIRERLAQGRAAA